MTANRFAPPHPATVGGKVPAAPQDADALEVLVALLQQARAAQLAPASSQRAPHAATVSRTVAPAPADLVALFASLLQGQAVQPAPSPAQRPPHPATMGRGGLEAAPVDLMTMLTALLQQVRSMQPALTPGQRPPHPATIGRAPAATPAASIPWPLPYPAQPYAVPGQAAPHAATVPRSWSSADAYDILAAQAALLAGRARPRHPATLGRGPDWR